MSENMKRVVLVDDDAVLRIGLKTLVDWRQHGYLLVGDAADGAQALALIRAHQPDIVITDMKMPGMDGLTLIKALQNLSPVPYIIVLSGYDDFPLVREAMKYGAADYLLKLELSPAVLLQSLADAPARSSAAPSDDQELQLRQERVLRDLVSRFYLDDQEIETRLREVGIRFSSPPVYCLLLKAGDLYRFEECTEEEYHTLRFSIRSIAAEIVLDCMDAYFADGRTGELYLFGEVRGALAAEGTDRLVDALAMRLRTMLAQYVDIPCVIGIGKGEKDAAGLSQACRQAAAAVPGRVYAAQVGVLWWKESRPPTPEAIPIPIYTLRQQLAKGMEALDAQAVHSALAQARTMIAEKCVPSNVASALVIELSSAVCEHFDRLGMNPDCLVCSHRDADWFGRMQSTGEILRWVDALAEDLRGYLGQERTRNGPAAVLRVEELLRKRFSGEISLTEVAAALELTPGYVSALLKRHTGMGFSEYLTRLRVESAKELLATTNWKVYAVAEAVGYEDAFYFSRQFKRLTGVSPMDWRRAAMQGGSVT